MPYPGIRPFRKDEWPVFCGRQRIVDELLDIMVKEQFVPVLGTSGCGKSSIVKAGLIATLEREYSALGAAWRAVEMRPGNTPMWCLSEALWTATHPGESTPPTPEQMATLRAVLGRGPNGIDRVLKEYGFPADLNLLLLVDQFEELFRFGVLGGEAETRTFLDQLLDVYEAQPHGIHIVLTMRADFISDCARWPRLAVALNQTIYLLRWMTDDELREAIAAPALLYRGKVEPELVERIIRDSGGKQDQLPVIEHALMWMWDRVGKQSGATLTLADYLSPEVGGIDGALSLHADQIYEGLSNSALEPNAPRDLRPVAQRLFQALTDVDGSGRAIRRPCTFGDLRATIDCQPAELLYVIDAFRKAGCSFLMPDETAEIKDTTPIDVSHEALIRQWSKMKTPEGGKGWLEKERQDAETWRSLAGETVSFQEDRRYRLSSKQTQRFQTWWKQREPSLAWVCRYWRDATSTFRDAQELIRLSARRRWLYALGIFAVGACIAALLLTTVIYLLDSRAQGRYASELQVQNGLLAQKTTELEQQKQELEHQKAELERANAELAAANKTNAELMAALAFKATKEWRTTDALVLAEKALRLGSSAMAEDPGNGASERSVSILEGAAYSALSRHYLVDKYNIAGNAWDWTPDGQFIVLADRTTVKLIDIASASTFKSFRLSEGAVYNLDISPDASLVVVSNDTIPRVEVWEVETESKLKDIDGWGTADNVVFSLDGRWLAISDGEKVAVVDTQDWHTVIELKDWVQAGNLVFSADSQYVAFTSDSGRAVVVSLKAPKEPVYQGDIGGLGGVPAFAPAHPMIALPVFNIDGTSTIRLIDFGSGKVRDIDLGPELFPSAIAFDETTLAAVADDGTVSLLDVQAWAPSATASAFDAKDWKVLGKIDQGSPTSLHFWPGESAWLVGTYEGPAAILDSVSGKVRGVLHGNGANYLTTFVADGQVIRDTNPTIGHWRSTPILQPEHFGAPSGEEISLQAQPIIVEGPKASTSSRASSDRKMAAQIAQNAQPSDQPRQVEQAIGVVYDGNEVSAVVTKSRTAVTVRYRDGREPEVIFSIGENDPLGSSQAAVGPGPAGLWVGMVDGTGHVSKLSMASRSASKLGALASRPTQPAHVALGISAGGTMLVVMNTGSAQFIGSSGAKRPRSFKDQGKPLTVDADRGRVLMATTDRQLPSALLVDLSSPQDSIELPLPDPSSAALTGALSSDGRFAAVVQENGLVNVWDLERRALVASMGEPYQGLILPAFPPEGGAVDVVASDGSVYRWHMYPSRDELELAVHDSVPRGLTDEERQQILDVSQTR